MTPVINPIEPGLTEESDDGWTVNGTWSYCSGAPYATHFLGHALISGADRALPTPLFFIAPRSQWRRLDDWGALEIYEDLLRKRSTVVPPIVRRHENPGYQFWCGDAVGMIGAAEAAPLNAAQQWHDNYASGAAAVAREWDLRIRRPAATSSGWAGARGPAWTK